MAGSPGRSSGVRTDLPQRRSIGGRQRETAGANHLPDATGRPGNTGIENPDIAKIIGSILHDYKKHFKMNLLQDSVILMRRLILIIPLNFTVIYAISNN